MMDRRVGASAGLLVALACSGCEQPPKPLAEWQAKAARRFYLDVTRCLYSSEHRTSISELPAALKADLRPASSEERFLFENDPTTKVWTDDIYRSHIVLAEHAEGECEVVADQIPVEATFAVVMQDLRKADPALRPHAVKPGYDPIAYQLESVKNGSRFTVRLDGSEPGGLAHPIRFLAGHASRFSMLYAKVRRQPEPTPS
jgi:hypothetical protein